MSDFFLARWLDAPVETVARWWRSRPPKPPRTVQPNNIELALLGRQIASEMDAMERRFGPSVDVSLRERLLGGGRQ